MRCWSCRWSDGRHDPACPDFLKTKEAKAMYETGWNDARAGKEPTSKNATYMIGWGSGNVALEEAENGYRPGIDGGQW